MAWLPDGEHFFKDILIRFDRMYERDRQTDTQTPHDDIGRACIASRGKNRGFRPISGFISEMMQYRAIVTMERR